MDTAKRWHSWSIKRNRYENVIAHIRKNVPEIDKYFYPQIKQEIVTKRGVRVKDSPLYEGYLFVRYDNPDQVFHKMSQCPWITTHHPGIVAEDEIRIMEENQGKLLVDIKTSRYRKGDTVVLLEGPFAGFEAKVKSVGGGMVKVRVGAQLLGKGVDQDLKEDLVERKSELQNTVVQDI